MKSITCMKPVCCDHSTDELVSEGTCNGDLIKRNSIVQTTVQLVLQTKYFPPCL